MILLTGGAGFIGSHTAVHLLNHGYDVLILDNFSNSNPSVLSRIERITGRMPAFWEADLLDQDRVGRILQTHDIRAVVHFAGLKAVGESVEKPLAYYENNLKGTLNLIHGMRDAGLKKLIFSSSATVYHPDSTPPCYETHPLGASNPYGWTKVMIEQILRDTAAADPDWSIALLRYFNPIGAHESGLIGEEPDGIPNNLLPYVSRVAAGELPFVRVFGGDYDTPDGTGVRDYIHVMDLAEGHLLALPWLEKNRGARAFNLGTGRGYSVLEIIAAFEKACGRPVPWQMAPRRAGDLPVCYANVDLARAELGFSARYDLGRMCADAWRWQQHATGGGLK